MYIRLETTSGMPIARQIADQIRMHCAGGTLCPGDRLPSVRQLAKDLTVNQNTVLRVYEKLTAEGLLERRHGDGTYVVDSLPPGRLKAQRELLVQDADRLVRRGSELGMSGEEIHKQVDDAIARRSRQVGAAAKGGQS